MDAGKLRYSSGGVDQKGDRNSKHSYQSKSDNEIGEQLIRAGVPVQTARNDYNRLVNYLGVYYCGINNSGDTSASWLKTVSDAIREYHALYDANKHRGKALGLDNILSKQLERIRNGNSEQGVCDSEAIEDFSNFGGGTRFQAKSDNETGEQLIRAGMPVRTA